MGRYNTLKNTVYGGRWLACFALTDGRIVKIQESQKAVSWPLATLVRPGLRLAPLAAD
jgi:hypothetical protein